MNKQPLKQKGKKRTVKSWLALDRANGRAMSVHISKRGATERYRFSDGCVDSNIKVIPVTITYIDLALIENGLITPNK